MFTWDERKAAANFRKHRVRFEKARTVFQDENALQFSDPEHSVNEDRFLMLGISYSLRLLVVCHCYRESENVIRIISARKADRKEQKRYWS